MAIAVPVNVTGLRAICNAAIASLEKLYRNYTSARDVLHGVHEILTIRGGDRLPATHSAARPGVKL
jgi:hypothetical protein